MKAVFACLGVVGSFFRSDNRAELHGNSNSRSRRV